MPTSNLGISGEIAGMSMTSTISRTATGQIGHSVALAAAKAGTLSTRTNNTDGTLTLGVSHGVTTGATIDLYWSGGRRYNVTVGTVSGTSVPISGGAGDNLPTQGDAITCQVQVSIDTDFAGDLLEMIGALCDQRGHLGFFDGSTLRLSVDLASRETWFWASGGTAANPLATYNVTIVKATQASSSAAATVKIGVLYDSN